eukprot:gene1436-2762_t
MPFELYFGNLCLSCLIIGSLFCKLLVGEKNAIISSPFYETMSHIFHIQFNPSAIFFAHYSDDLKKIQSTIDYSLDKYRLELTTLMQSSRRIIENMDAVDKRVLHFHHIHAKFKSEISEIPSYWQKNEDVLNILLAHNNINLIMTLPQYSSINTNMQSNENESNSNIHSYDNLMQLLIHIIRDWSTSGLKVRKALYADGILHYLQVYCDKSLGNKVLIPGAGLGRLSLEVAAMGYKYDYV